VVKLDEDGWKASFYATLTFLCEAVNNQLWQVYAVK
jgi:hypothetical protein